MGTDSADIESSYTFCVRGFTKKSKVLKGRKSGIKPLNLDMPNTVSYKADTTFILYEIKKSFIHLNQIHSNILDNSSFGQDRFESQTKMRQSK